jgi:hypothetical protein
MLQVLIVFISPRFNLYEKRHQLQHLYFSCGILAMSGPWNFSVQQELEQQPLNMALLLLQQELAVSRPIVLLISSSYDFHIPKPKKFVFCCGGNSRKQYSYPVLLCFPIMVCYFICADSWHKWIQHTQRRTFQFYTVVYNTFPVMVLVTQKHGCYWIWTLLIVQK